MNETRRDFLKKTTAGLTALAATKVAADLRAAEDAAPRRAEASAAGLTAPKLGQIRWGFIGVGARGSGHIKDFAAIPGCSIKAVCDVDPAALRSALAVVSAAGQPEPAGYGDGPEAFRALVARDDIDAVLIATPWRWHVPMCLAAMRAGKHAFCEVPIALTIEDCWALVETAEETRRHCMMLENCCYGEDELMLLNLCRQGVLGELVHGEGAYLHNLRDQLDLPLRSEGLWRPIEHTRRNGNLYPTHGLGIIAECMSINRGDRFVSLVSMSSRPLGLSDYLDRIQGNHPLRAARFLCGDMNTSVVQTALGRTILVQHDTSNFRPYSRGTMLQGTHGIFAGYPSRIAVEGQTKGDEWEMDLSGWQSRYGHPLWKTYGPGSSQGGPLSAGHGGMDGVMRRHLVHCLQEGLPMDMDVYDAAAWSAIGPVSEEAVRRGGAPVAIPDFTRGGWRTTAPLGIRSS